MKKYIRFLIFGYCFLSTIKTAEFFIFKEGVAQYMTPEEFVKIAVNSVCGIVVLTIIVAFFDYKENKEKEK